MGDVYMVNGKILSGLPNHAKDIIFDNDGTTLSSTNTEDAIKEVNSKLSDHVTVTANGTETWGQLLTRLYNAIDGSKITPKAVLVIPQFTIVLQLSVMSGVNYQFSYSNLNRQLPSITYALLGSTSTFAGYDTGQYSDLTNQTASGDITIYY